MAWKKLHQPVWFNPRFRAQPRDVRTSLADLMCLTDDAGRLDRPPPDELAAIFDVDTPRALEIIAALERLKLLRSDGAQIVVCSVEEDREYSESRRAGGKARRAQEQSAKHDAKHGASTMLNNAAASLSSGSGSSSGSDSGSVSESGVRKPEKKRSGKVREVVDFATVELPPAINTPRARQILLDAAAVRAEKRHDPIGPAGWKMRLRQLEAWGVERFLAAVIASAPYEGLFEPKEQRNGVNFQVGRNGRLADGTRPGEYAENGTSLPRVL